MPPTATVAGLATASVILFVASAAIAPAYAAAPGPDFSGPWARNSFAYETIGSGPGPVENASHLPSGIRDRTTLVGDITNPILTPESAQTVRRFGEISHRGIGFPDPNNQCWPEGPPYIYRVLETQILQQGNEILILYSFDHQYRRIRLNQNHPARLTPSWYGDSVGHFDGDTLVVDTVGVKLGRFSMIDRFGTPYSDAMHLVERFRLIDREVANAAMARNERENGRIAPDGGGGDVDPDDTGKALQVTFTVEDPKSFTQPWSATVTYRRNIAPWQERPCAENLHNFGVAPDSQIPVAGKADF